MIEVFYSGLRILYVILWDEYVGMVQIEVILEYIHFEGDRLLRGNRIFEYVQDLKCWEGSALLLIFAQNHFAH